MSFSTMIYPPPAPPSFFTVAGDKIASLSKWHKGFSVVGLGCVGKALIDIKLAESANQSEVDKYLLHSIAGFVTTAALTCIGVFAGSVAMTALGCVGVGYTFWAVYQIGQADPALKGLVSRAYFGLAAVALVPTIGAGFGVVEVIGSALFPPEVTICMPFVHPIYGVVN